jgi:hypothetical protein
MEPMTGQSEDLLELLRVADRAIQSRQDHREREPEGESEDRAEDDDRDDVGIGGRGRRAGRLGELGVPGGQRPGHRELVDAVAQALALGAALLLGRERVEAALELVDRAGELALVGGAAEVDVAARVGVGDPRRSARAGRLGGHVDQVRLSARTDLDGVGHGRERHAQRARGAVGHDGQRDELEVGGRLARRVADPGLGWSSRLPVVWRKKSVAVAV